MQASSIDYRISANTAADAGSPHGIAASRSTLRLAVLGLSPGERQLLRAIVDVLDSRTEARWELVDDDSDCDLRLHRPGIDLPHATATLTGLVLSEDESMPAEPGVRLIMPPRVMAVMELLNDAHDRLRQPRVEPAVDELIEAEADDGKSLASALARLLENRLEHSLRARIVGHGTLFLCRQARTFCTDFPLSQLQDALSQHRFVMTSIPDDQPELRSVIGEGRPIDEVLWTIGLATSWERSPERLSQARFRLRRWPNLTRLSHRPEHIQLCAVISTRAMTVAEIASATGLPLSDIRHFLHACELCGLSEECGMDGADLLPVAAVPATQARSGALGGLFSRLRQSLGL